MPSLFSRVSTTPSRYHFIIGLVLCAISYHSLSEKLFISEIIQEENNNDIERKQLDNSTEVLSLSVGFLHPSAKLIPYGRQAPIDENYISLTHPNVIDKTMLRRQNDLFTKQKDIERNYDDKCSNIFLFMPHEFRHNGHGSQLNNYILATMIATYTNRAMVILEPPSQLNNIKGNSQFGCPKEAWTYLHQTTAVSDTDEIITTKKSGWNTNLPNGINRLIKHPAWLSRQCSVPCENIKYKQWDLMRLNNNVTLSPTPHFVKCRTNIGKADEIESNVLVMGGEEIHNYFNTFYKKLMFFDRDHPPSISGAEWAIRLGASTTESQIFSTLTNEYDIYDYLGALIVRSGLLQLQPWIARDIKAFIQQYIPDLPLTQKYDSMHIRRGATSLTSIENDEAKRYVVKYWETKRGYYKCHESNPFLCVNYIPFVHYLRQYEDIPCNGDEDGSDEDEDSDNGEEEEANEDNDQEDQVEAEVEDGSNVRLVYIASDDRTEVQSEIEALPKDSDGYTLLPTSDEDGDMTSTSCHRFKFIFSSYIPQDRIAGTSSCEDRYQQNIAAVADLMILAKSNIFIGEYNSNWGRLIRTFRLRMNDKFKIFNGESLTYDSGQGMKVAWGNERPSPPGW